MIIPTRFLLLLVLPIGTTLRAQDAVRDPIDVQLERCLQDTTGETTAGMRQCTYLAYQAWEVELNTIYKALLDHLAPEGQEALRSAQQAWLKYRDAQLHLNHLIYYKELQGSLYTVVGAGANTELVKQRALELRQQLSVLSEGK